MPNSLRAPGSPKRVGLLGGAFDPPHDGHLRLAELAWENLRLDELRFVPANAAPLKNKPSAPPEMRLAMLEAMLDGTPFTVEGIELGLGATSYTFNTLEALSKREPGAAWILIVGSDQGAAFESWRSAGQILELASVAVAPRPGSFVAQGGVGAAGPCAMPELPEILSCRLATQWLGVPGQTVILPSTELDLASSRIRRQLACGIRPPGLSDQVAASISQKKLYH